MTKRLQVVITVFFLVIGGVIAWQLVRLREPVYKNQRLSTWLERYRPDSDTSEIDQAVRAIGPKAIPILLDNLRASDSTLKLWLVALGMHFTPAETRHMRAEKGFSALGDKASNAVPALTAIYEESAAPSARRSAANSLVEIGPAAKPAISCMIISAGDTNSAVRAFAVYTLGRMALEPEVVNPVLIRALRDRDKEVRYNAAFGLGAMAFMGVDAQVATSALVESLQDDYGTARAAAAMALGHIHQHPEVAVPALTAALHDSQVFVRVQAAAALAQYGTNAKPAFTALTELSRDDNHDASNAAWTALRAIDRDGADGKPEAR